MYHLSNALQNQLIFSPPWSFKSSLIGATGPHCYSAVPRHFEVDIYGAYKGDQGLVGAV